MIDKKTIQFTLNDKPFDCQIGTSVAEIVTKITDRENVAVALNEHILSQDDWSKIIKPNDTMLIFGAIAGG